MLGEHVAPRLTAGQSLFTAVACLLKGDAKKPGLPVRTFDNPCDCKRAAGMIVPASCASQIDHRRDHRPSRTGSVYAPVVEQAHAELILHREPAVCLDVLERERRQGAFLPILERARLRA